VLALHNASDSQSGMPERLSSATTQDPAAAVVHASTSRGALRTGTGLGSTMEARRDIAVVLPVPCSPVIRTTGCDRSGISPATSTVAGRESSNASKWITYFISATKSRAMVSEPEADRVTFPSSKPNTGASGGPPLQDGPGRTLQGHRGSGYPVAPAPET
jgi:hypothetical protein